MRFLLTLLMILYYCNICFSLTISTNKTYNSTTTLSPFGSITSISSLLLNSNVILNSDNGLVRVILIDNKGVEYMVYEAYIMIVDSKSIIVTNAGDETKLLFNVKPASLRIIINDASLSIQNLVVD